MPAPITTTVPTLDVAKRFVAQPETPPETPSNVDAADLRKNALRETNLLCSTIFFIRVTSSQQCTLTH
jgi:hypothetical protein